MFTILGGDGKEYGPVPADQIRRWIAAGRANLDTKAKAAGSDEWRRLGDHAEFGAPADIAPPLMTPVASAAPTGGNPFAAASASPVPAVVLAERGQRLLARVIDWMIEILCSIPGGIILFAEVLKVVITVSQGKEPDFSELDVPKLILGGALLLVARLGLLVVQVWMLTTRGQSIGKRLMGIRVVRQDGSAAGIVYAWVLRELTITGIGIMASLIPFIGPLLLQPAFHITDWCMIFSDDQRCLHDRIAGTKVVKA